MRFRSASRMARRLTALAVLVGLLSLLSYVSGAHIALRYLDPPVGAWWQSNEFWIMEGAASALGMLIGIRIGARLVEPALRNRIQGGSVIAAAIALAWVAPACAALARIGWNARGQWVESGIVGLAGYSSGLFIDKLLIAGVYFLKTAGFAFFAGLVLFGLVLAASFASVRAGEPAQKPAAGA